MGYHTLPGSVKDLLLRRHKRRRRRISSRRQDRSTPLPRYDLGMGMLLNYFFKPAARSAAAERCRCRFTCSGVQAGESLIRQKSGDGGFRNATTRRGQSWMKGGSKDKVQRRCCGLFFQPVLGASLEFVEIQPAFPSGCFPAGSRFDSKRQPVPKLHVAQEPGVEPVGVFVGGHLNRIFRWRL